MPWKFRKDISKFDTSPGQGVIPPGAGGAEAAWHKLQEKDGAPGLPPPSRHAWRQLCLLSVHMGRQNSQNTPLTSLRPQGKVRRKRGPQEEESRTLQGSGDIPGRGFPGFREHQLPPRAAAHGTGCLLSGSSCRWLEPCYSLLSCTPPSAAPAGSLPELCTAMPTPLQGTQSAVTARKSRKNLQNCFCCWLSPAGRCQWRSLAPALHPHQLLPVPPVSCVLLRSFASPLALGLALGAAAVVALGSRLPGTFTVVLSRSISFPWTFCM